MTKSLALFCALISTQVALADTNTTDVGTIRNVYGESKSYNLIKETKGNPRILSHFKDQFSIGFFSDDNQAKQFIGIFKQNQKDYVGLRPKSVLKTQSFQDVNGKEIIDPVTGIPAATQKRADEILHASDKSAVAYPLEETYEDLVLGRKKQHAKGTPLPKPMPFEQFNIDCLWQAPVYQAESCTTDYQEECDLDPFTGESVNCHIVATTTCTPAGYYQNFFDCRITGVFGYAQAVERSATSAEDGDQF